MMDEEKKKRIKKGIKSNERWILFWIVIFSGLAGGLGWLLFNQNSVSTGSNPEAKKVDALICKSDDFLYPVLTYDNSNNKEFKIIVTFMDDNARSVSLQQVLRYSNGEISAESESANHAAMNTLFGADGLTADALGASYAQTSTGMRFGLYENFDKIDAASAKYFLLDGLSNFDYNSIKQTYEGIGLNCDK